MTFVNRSRMKVDLIEPTSKAPCALGEVYGVVGMTFHGAIIQLGFVK